MNEHDSKKTTTPYVTPITGGGRLCVRLERALGPLLSSALLNPTTVEVSVNPDGSAWVERLGEKAERVGALLRADVETILRLVAGHHGREVTAEHPLIEAEFPLDGSRFAGVLPPAATGPCFSIRRRALRVFTLDQYVDDGIATAEQAAVLRSLIARHRNLMVVGGTSSGKTTLVNALLACVADAFPAERVVVIEDTAELQCISPNVVAFHSTPTAPMQALVKTTLRFTPDRIVVGEVRGGEALDLLTAWNTGHEGGIATVHANSASAGLMRIETMVSQNREAPRVIAPFVAEAVQALVFIQKTASGRREITEILEVDGFSESGGFVFRPATV